MKLNIRLEEPGDIDAIRSVVFRAYRSQAQALLVERLREEDAAALSLVAVADGKIVGHILFSPMTIDPEITAIGVFGLTPLAVAPEYQKQGIGSKLVRRGLDMGLGLGWGAVFVLGSASFYARFGFEDASKYALFTEYDVPEVDLLVMPLHPHLLNFVHGTVLYHPVFRELNA